LRKQSKAVRLNHQLLEAYRTDHAPLLHTDLPMPSHFSGAPIRLKFSLTAVQPTINLADSNDPYFNLQIELEFR
jgi:hypothetical protein